MGGKGGTFMVGPGRYLATLRHWRISEVKNLFRFEISQCAFHFSFHFNVYHIQIFIFEEVEKKELGKSAALQKMAKIC